MYAIRSYYESAVAAVADSVIVLDQPELAGYQPEVYLAAVQQVGSRVEPRAVLLGNDTASLLSEELAPVTPLERRLAPLLDIDVDVDTDALTVRVTAASYNFV